MQRHVVDLDRIELLFVRGRARGDPRIVHGTDPFVFGLEGLDHSCVATDMGRIWMSGYEVINSGDTLGFEIRDDVLFIIPPIASVDEDRFPARTDHKRTRFRPDIQHVNGQVNVRFCTRIRPRCCRRLNVCSWRRSRSRSRRGSAAR